jgi:hypothetical protein
MMSSDARATRRYTALLLAATLLPLAALAGFNLGVDPLAYFGDPASPRPAIYQHYRLVKARGLARAQVGCVILGSSRLVVGLDPDSPRLAALGGAYNAALTDGRIAESTRLAEHALALLDRPRLIVGLDFYSFHLADPPNPDWREDRLAVAADGRRQWWHRWADAGRLLFGLAGTRRSWEALDQLGRPLDAAERTFRRNGFGAAPLDYVRAHGGSHGAFRHKELGEMLLRGNAFFRSLGNPSALAENWAAFDRLLTVAAREGVELDLILPPVHARFLELLDLIRGSINAAPARADRGNTWGVNPWKERLVRHLAQVRARCPAARIRLWDFMTDNAYTTAALVGPGDPAAMPYHWEPSHFLPVVGEAILARILAPEAADAADPAADFGVRLETGMLPRHFAVQAERRAAWRAMRPAECAELAADWELVTRDQAQASAEWSRR